MITASAPGRKMAAQRGFTLIEIMVVIVIIAILAGFITLSIGNRTSEDRLDIEAQRLQLLLELASEEAQLKSLQIGFRVDPRSYDFLILGPKRQWASYTGEGPLRKRQLPPDMRLDLRVDDRTPPADRPKHKGQPPPQALIFSSGQTTAFTLTLSAVDVGYRYQIKVDALGNIKRKRENLSR